MKRVLRSLGAAALLAAGCSDPAVMSGPAGLADLAMAPYVAIDPLVLDRPYEQSAPADYDASKSYPLVVLLHGYGGTAFFIDSLTGMSAAVDAKQFVYAYPQALRWDGGYSAWNYKRDAKGPDDLAYIDAVIGDTRRRYNVDPKRIFVSGHSNGAAMAYYYGCERADRIAGIVPLAGSFTTDPMKCAPTGPISVLHVQGDKDGDPTEVRATVAAWAAKSGCSATSDTTAPNVDIDRIEPGAETSVEVWPGCKAGADVRLWMMKNVPHNPGFSPAFAPAVIDWLRAHPRP